MKSSVSHQSVIALSSGEAEFAATVKGSSVGLGIVALGRDLGEVLPLRVHTDSTAAKGITGRKGIGKIRHLHTPLLWVQHKVANNTLSIYKVDGVTNVADLGTKELARPRMEQLLAKCGFAFRSGRHRAALKAQIGEASTPAAVNGLSGYGRATDDQDGHGSHAPLLLHAD